MNADIITAAANHGRDWFDALSFGLGVVTLYFLIRYTHHAKKQREAAEKANEMASKAREETRVSGERVLEETRRSNRATEDSNKTARNAFELSSRAFVFFDGVKQTGTHVSNDIELKVTITNYGKGPAGRIKTTCFPAAEARVTELLFVNAQSVPSCGCLAPGQAYIFDAVITADILKEADGKRVLFGGTITYEDYLGVERKTLFCVERARGKWTVVPEPQFNTYT
jgi:hypothetical protein